MGTIDYVVRLQALDGTWETAGAERAIGTSPESLTYSHNEWGPDKASFDLKRSIFAMWPDIGAFAPVEIEIGGVIVWEGRAGETPIHSGAEQVINVQCQGWQYHLDDDVYQRAYVHSKLTDWKDTRSFLEADLTRWVSGPTAGAAQGVVTLGWANGTPAATNNAVGVTLDLGPSGLAKRIVIELDAGTVTDGSIKLYARGSNNIPEVSAGPGFDAIKELEVKGGTGLHAGTFTTACRYVTLLLVYVGVGGTYASDQICRIKKAYVFADTAYEAGNASVLHASTINQDALERATLLLSSDFSKIAPTSFAIPDFVLTKLSSPRESIEAANAYHNWIAKLLPGRRFSFQPRPTAPALEMGAWAGADFDDTSSNSSEEIYNRAIVEAVGPDGTPVQVERAAVSQPGVIFLAEESPSADNPSFAVNTTSWTASGGGKIKRATEASEYHSAPAAGRWEPTGSNQTLTETFTGTFKKGRTYRLSFWVKTNLANTFHLTFGTATDYAFIKSVLATLAYEQRSIVWTPMKDTTGVTLVFQGGNELFLDDLTLAVAEPTLVDRRNFRRTKVLQVSSAITETEGQQLSDTWLQAHMTTPFKGDANAYPGSVRTVFGGQLVHPSQLGLHTQELFRIGHLIDPDTGGIGRDGTIAEVTYTHKDQKAAVVLDDKRANFDAYLNRLAVVQSVGS